MNIVHIYGGLGNQMFQYAFYKYLSQEYPDTYLSLEYYNNKRSRVAHDSKFLLSSVFQNIQFKTHEDIITKILYKDAPLWRTIRITRKLIFNKKKVFDTYNLVDDRNFLSTNFSKKNHFRSYWQNIKFANDTQEILRNDFEFITEGIGPKNKECLEHINQVNSVSLHVRRGDYIKLQERYGNICTADYYSKAIAAIKEQVHAPVFYIFSDDIEWCKNSFHDIENKVLVDWNNENSHYDMLLMSKCKHNIIANSSFSWWAAWLNKNPNKMVIIPSKWTVDLSNRNYIYKNTVTI